MEIVTERLRIMPLTWQDVDEIHQMNSLEAVAAFNTIGIPENLTQTVALLRPVIEEGSKPKRMKFGWTLRHKTTNVFMGEVGMRLSPERFRKGEIHYNLLPTYWGQGFAREAVKAIIDYGFKQLKLHRIEAGVATENIRSIKLLENVGMLREGVCRKILPINGVWKDNYIYAILEEDSSPL